MANNKHSILITGACGGIGHALVNAFQAEGHHVIATDVILPTKALHYENFVQADLQKTVTDDVYAAEIFERIRNLLPSNNLKALINNAAVQILAPGEHLTRADWSKTINVNLLAPFFWTQEFVEELANAKGSVINISSIHARLTKPEFSAYATSKAALSGLTKSLALELGNRIRVMAIEPAAIDTPMLRAGFEHDAENFARLEQYHPTQSIGTSDELARLAVTLVSNNLPFLNGAVIQFDGGVGWRLHDPC